MLERIKMIIDIAKYLWMLILEFPGMFFGIVAFIITLRLIIHFLLRAKKMQDPKNYTPTNLLLDQIKAEKLWIAILISCFFKYTIFLPYMVLVFYRCNYWVVYKESY